MVALKVRTGGSEEPGIITFWYGKYRIPRSLRGRIAKYYLTDSRRDANSEGYQTSVDFEKYLSKKGIRVVTDRDFGLTSLRWAAMKSGIGIIRRNNFFYTERGSYQYLEAFLIDIELSHIEDPSSIPPCPGGCRACVKGCPTNSLDGPFSMCRNTCVSCLTTWDGWDLRKEPLQAAFGSWIYGCDTCQDVCPYNRNGWKDMEDFPGLRELEPHLSNMAILQADYKWLHYILQPKLWYIPEDRIWRYKTNALSGILNEWRVLNTEDREAFEKQYCPVILKNAQEDKSSEVQEMASWVLGRIEKEKR